MKNKNCDMRRTVCDKLTWFPGTKEKLLLTF